MRLMGAVLICLLAALPAAAQRDDPAARDDVSVKPTSQVGKIRKVTAKNAAPLRARAAGAALSAAAQQAPDATSAATGESPVRMAAAASKKRARAMPLRGLPQNSSTMPLPERMTLEFDLAWTGDYNSLTGGEANDKLTAAIRSFQRHRKFRETGVLNTQERALLAASAKARQAQVGWTMLDDAVTGVRLGIPTRQTPNKTQSKIGTRWTSAQGQVQIETFKIREPGTTLSAVFDQQRKEPSNRRIDANVLKGDSFILSGMQGLKKFLVRGEFKDGEVRGLTVLWDQATETIVDPIAMAMTFAFTPFPGSSAVAQIEPAPKRKVEYGTGIVVSASGHILTDRQVTDGCNVIVVGGYGDAAALAEDRNADLALIRIYGAPALVPAALGPEGNGPDLTLVGIADPQSQGGGSAITTASVRLRGDVAEPSPQPGFSGAAAFDSQGRFAGMAELKTPVVTAAGPAAAKPQATVVPIQTIRSFLDAQQITPAAGKTGIDAAKASVVRVICVRK
jgi:Trypsin-like peptidase domain